VERVVVVGGGFGGLAAARRLARRPVEIVLVDRLNHHLFQPLLYQVATAVLSPEDVATPIRTILARRPSVRVLLDEVVGVDLDHRQVRLRGGELRYDRLVLAPGSVNAYFGHGGWPAHAVGLKTLDDALEIRRRVLLAYERAASAATPVDRRSHLTFVVIGGGPTGVELAGALAEIACLALRRDFRDIPPEEVRIVLLEGGARLLGAFPERLACYAEGALGRLGVRVCLAAAVREIGEGFVDVGSERIEARTILWAAGVSPAPLVAALSTPHHPSGRVLVAPDLSLPDHPEVFVVGDAAYLEQDGRPLPGVAPVATQAGCAAADNVWRQSRSRPTRPFRYRDKGNLATIGRSRAVADLGRLRLRGTLAWLLWLFVHILYLVGFANRLVVLIRWAWAYVIDQRGARLIYGGGWAPAAAAEDARPKDVSAVSGRGHADP
jgi:NADH dehydrogenase